MHINNISTVGNKLLIINKYMFNVFNVLVEIGK